MRSVLWTQSECAARHCGGVTRASWKRVMSAEGSLPPTSSMAGGPGSGARKGCDTSRIWRASSRVGEMTSATTCEAAVQASGARVRRSEMRRRAAARRVS